MSTHYYLFVGPDYTFAQFGNGKWVGWGMNSSGLLGFKTKKEYQLTPIPLPLFEKQFVRKLFLGINHAMALVEDFLYAWGTNKVGQLGIGITETKHSPVLVPFFKGDVSAQLGNDFSFIRSEGTYYVCGNNMNGQLGIGCDFFVENPISIDYLSKSKLLFVGGDFCMAVNNDNSLWVWGKNLYGKLGTGDLCHRFVPTCISIEFGVIKDILFGENHTLLLNDAGQLFSWGLNNLGQLGFGYKDYECIPTLIPFFESGGVTKIIVEQHSCMALRDDSWYCWGNNFYGQLSKQNSRVWGYDKGGAMVTIINFEKTPFLLDIKGDIFTGWNHGFSTKGKRSLYGWGSNSYGQLGLGKDIDFQPFPKSVPLFKGKVMCHYIRWRICLGMIFRETLPKEIIAIIIFKN